MQSCGSESLIVGDTSRPVVGASVPHPASGPGRSRRIGVTCLFVRNGRVPAHETAFGPKPGRPGGREKATGLPPQPPHNQPQSKKVENNRKKHAGKIGGGGGKGYFCTRFREVSAAAGGPDGGGKKGRKGRKKLRKKFGG